MEQIISKLKELYEELEKEDLGYNHFFEEQLSSFDELIGNISARHSVWKDGDWLYDEKNDYQED